MSRVSLFAKPVWTPPEDTQLRELIELGESVAIIAAKIERSEKAVSERAAKLGLKAKGK
jgi:hypothetical protein